MRYRFTLALVLFFAITAVVQANSLIMGRVSLKAEIAYAYLTSSLEEHGYTIAHVQTCDLGLADFGYKSDFYRVIFFGKLEEVRELSAKFPELVPYLPLKIAIFAEKDETVLTALDPTGLADYFPSKELRIQFVRWHSDLESIMHDMQVAGQTHKHKGKE